MKTERFEALGQLISVEIFDEDMRETIWPVPGHKKDEQDSIWIVKAEADKRTDDQIGRYFLNKHLIDYGNSYTYTVHRGRTEMRRFIRRIREGVKS